MDSSHAHWWHTLILSVGNVVPKPQWSPQIDLGHIVIALGTVGSIIGATFYVANMLNTSHTASVVNANAIANFVSRFDDYRSAVSLREQQQDQVLRGLVKSVQQLQTQEAVNSAINRGK